MLLWERLTATSEPQGVINGHLPVPVPIRLPFDTRCAHITRSGRRCRGKILKGREHCALHDPALSERRKQRASAAGSKRRTLAHLPDGYLRKLTTTASVGSAMDRLYREVRLGVITPEMGLVLFGILTRLMDSGLLDANGKVPRAPRRTKAARVRPKLTNLLTRPERKAWEKAVAGATQATTRTGTDESALDERRARKLPVSLPGGRETSDKPLKLALQAAS